MYADQPASPGRLVTPLQLTLESLEGEKCPHYLKDKGPKSYRTPGARRIRGRNALLVGAGARLSPALRPRVEANEQRGDDGSSLPVRLGNSSHYPLHTRIQ